MWVPANPFVNTVIPGLTAVEVLRIEVCMDVDVVPETLETRPGLITLPAADDAPPDVHSRVTIGPAEDWVQQREVDYDYQSATTPQQLVLLLDYQHHARRQSLHFRMVSRLKTMRGVQDASQWRVNFDPSTQQLVIHSITTRRDGEDIEHANIAKFRFLQREAQMESLILDGTWTVLLLLEDVRVDDILDVSYTISTSRRFLANRYSAFTQIPNSLPIRAFYLSVRFPKDEPMKRAGNDSAFEPAIRELDGEVEWTWQAERIEPIEPEARVPAWHLRSRWIHLSTYESWHEIAAAVAEVWPARGEDHEVTTYAQELLREAPSLSSAVRRAIDFVQDDIRYLSVNEDLGGQIPASPAVVMRRRFGDCKDKSLLLAQLLKALGIEARPVLVNTFLCATLRELLPSPDVFNHVVVEYVVNGNRRWVDATARMQGGTASARTGVACGLGLAVDGTVEALEEIVAPAIGQSSQLVDETWYLDTAKMDAVLVVTYVATGADADDLRRWLAHEGSEAVAKRREEFYRTMFSNLTRIEEMKSLDDRAANRIALAESYRVENAFIQTQEPRMCGFVYGSHLMQSILVLPAAAKTPRQSPLAMRRPGTFEHRIQMKASSMGRRNTKPVKQRSDAFDFYMEDRKTPGTWLWNYSLELKADSVPADQCVGHQRDVKAIWPCTRLQVTLPGGVQASSRRIPTPADLLSALDWNVDGKTIASEQPDVPEGAPRMKSRPRGMQNRNVAPTIETAPMAEKPSIEGKTNRRRSSRSSRRRWRARLRALWIWVAIVVVAALAIALLVTALRHTRL